LVWIMAIIPEDTKDQEESERNKKAFLKAVFNPEEFQKICEALGSKTTPGSNSKVGEVVRQLLEQLKEDIPTIDRIIRTYMKSEVQEGQSGFVLSSAIKVVKGKDSCFFG